MRVPELPREINFVKVGAVAAFLLAATLAAAFASFPALSDVDTPRTEGEEFLNDIVDKKNFAIAIVWLFALLGLLIVPYALGLYYGLRRWGESYMRLALVAAVVGAVLLGLAQASAAAVTAYIVPAWAEAGDEATRAMLLSDFQILNWVGDATFSMFSIVITVATIAASLVMLRLGDRWWQGVAWIGILSGVAGIFEAFGLAAEGFAITAGFISGILAFFWFLGAGIGLWRLPAAEAAAA
ncbi:MAG: DUF4386 family protein [Dehalococcoidia bacterium]